MKNYNGEYYKKHSEKEKERYRNYYNQNKEKRGKIMKQGDLVYEKNSGSTVFEVKAVGGNYVGIESKDKRSKTVLIDNIIKTSDYHTVHKDPPKDKEIYDIAGKTNIFSRIS